MNGVKIITNNVPRETIDPSQLTEKERAEFDYLDWHAIEIGEEYASFIRYKDELHDLGEFSNCGSNFDFGNWHGVRSDSYFSGMLIKFVDPETVIVGRFYC